jgi:hypothetical protein
MMHLQGENDNSDDRTPNQEPEAGVLQGKL